MELFKLFGSIFINNEDANKKIDETDNKGKNTASTFGNMIGTAVKWGAAIVGAATTAGGAMLKLANDTAEYSGEILDASRKSSLTIENMQQLKYAGEQSGVALEDLVNTAVRLDKSLAQAVGGNTKLKSAFEELKVSTEDASGKTRAANDVFNDTITRLAELGDSAEATRLGNEIFGKSYANLKPLLAEGAEGIEELKNRASELGIVMSDEAIMAGDNFGDSLEGLKETFSGITRQLSADFIPILQAGIDFLMQNMPAIRETLGGVFTALQSSFQSVMPLLTSLLTTSFPALMGLFSELATNILPPFIGLFSQIVSAILPVLIDLFTGIAQTVLPPLVDILNTVVNVVLPPFIGLFTEIINQVLPPLMALFNEIIGTLLPPLITLFNEIIEAVLPVIMELFGEFTEYILPPLMELINEIVEVILPPLLAIFNELAEVVLPLVMKVFESMKPIIEPAMKAVGDIIKTITALIKGDWEGVWNGIKDFFSNILDFIVKAAEGFGEVFEDIFNGIGEIITDIWDWIVQGIKDAINWIIGGINKLIDGLSSVTEAVGDVIGIDLSIPKIPMLANGGEITRGGHVIVGEAGPEMLELPQGAKVKPLDRVGGQTNGIVELDGHTIAKAMAEPFSEMIRVKTALAM